jgi:hypothetical protein
MKDKTITVWFSCGAASAVAAKKTLELYGDSNKVIIVNSPVKEEHEDNQRFLKDVETWLRVSILTATNRRFPDASAITVWDKRKYMSGIKGAPCTSELKKNARFQFEMSNPSDHIVLGFTADEKERHERFTLSERSDVLPVLIDLNITKQDCFHILLDAGLKLPEVYSLGFPNANCIGCVKSQSPTYWNLVRRKFPDIFEERAKQSRELGCKLVVVKGKRIFLDELNPKQKGGKIKSWDCGIFCDIPKQLELFE